MKFGLATEEDLANYSEKFDIDRRVLVVDNAKYTPVFVVPEVKVDPRWVFDFGKATRLAGLLNINVNVIMSFGAIESVSYSDVVTGKFISPEADDYYDYRSYRIDSARLWLITMYSKLRNFGNIGKPHPFLVEIIEDAGIKKLMYDRLLEALAPLETDVDTIRWYRKNKKPRELVSFLLGNLIEMLLTIYDQPNKTLDTALLRQKFVVAVAKHLLKYDEMLTTYGHINWSLFRKDGSATVVNEDGVTDESNETGGTAVDVEESEDEDEDVPFVDRRDIDEEVDEEDRAFKMEDSGTSGMD